MKPRTVHMTSAHPLLDTRILLKECVTLARADYDVHLVAVGDACTSGNQHMGVTIHAVRRTRSRIGRMTLTAFRVFVAAARARGTIYHIHDAELLPWAHVLRLSGASVVFDMHENLPRFMLTKDWIPRALRPAAARVVRIIERYLLKSTSVIFAEESYRPDYPWVRSSTVVLNMPIVTSLLEVSECKHDLPTVVYFGSVCTSRGSLITPKVLGILKARGVTVNWECIGRVTDQHRSQILAEARRHGVGSQVRLHGYLPPDEGWKLVARCHLGLAILSPEPNMVESYPTKLFEYMALALPVVVSHFPLYRSVVEESHCGLCVDPTDPELIADAIAQILSSSSIADAMGAAGRQAVVGKYNWESESASLISFYEGLSPGR